MKTLLLLLLFAAITYFAHAQNVGIGTSIPDTSGLLHIALGTSTTKGLLITGTDNAASTVPNLGGGNRMMFYPGKGAFRAGSVNGTLWDNANVGRYSSATGADTKAAGSYSTAMGYVTTASGAASTAMGYNTIASGLVSTAIGNAGQANADYSTAIGETVTTNSWASTSLGRHNDPIVTSPSTSWILTEPLLIVGNGTGAADKKNALVILKNGNAGIGINTPNAPLAFTNITGSKISLYESAPNSQYGFAVQSGQLQLYSDASAAKISFGYYTSGIYTERMYLTAKPAGKNYGN